MLTTHDSRQEHQEKENWLKFYVNPYSGMAEADLTEPVHLNQANLEVGVPHACVRIYVVSSSPLTRFLYALDCFN